MTSGLIDLGEVTEEIDTADDFDPFSSNLPAKTRSDDDGGQVDLLGGALTTDDIEGLEGTYDVSEGRIHAQPDLIQEEDEDEDEDEDDDEDEENSVVEKDDLPEKVTSATDKNMASMSDNERRGYETQYDDVMMMNSGPVETNGHHEYEEEEEYRQDYHDDDDVTVEASFTVQSEASYTTDDRYSPPESPTVSH